MKRSLKYFSKRACSKTKKDSHTSNSSHTSQSQQTSQNSSSPNSSSSSSSSSTKSERSSSSSSSSSSSNSSIPSPNKASNSSTPSNGETVSQDAEKDQAETPTQPVENKEKANQTDIQQPEQKTENSVVQNDDKQKTGESPTPENPKTEKTQEEVEKEEIETWKKSLKKALNTIQKTLQTYKTKLTELQDKINGLQPTSTDSNEKSLVEEKKSSYLQRGKELETTIQTLTQQQTTLSQQLSTLLSKSNITKADIQTIKNQLTPLQEKVKILENDANQLINEVNSYEKDLTPEKPSGIVPKKIWEYFQKVRTYLNGPHLCTAYALAASTELLRQQNKVLPIKEEPSARSLESSNEIKKFFTINKPQTSEEIKNTLLNAPAWTIVTLRFSNTPEPVNQWVSHAMVSLGGGKYTDFIGDQQRTIDLNNCNLIANNIWGFQFTDNLGKKFYYVTKQWTTKSAIMIPKNTIGSWNQTTFDFTNLWDVFSHNYKVQLNKKVYQENFANTREEKINQAKNFAQKTGLDYNVIFNNFMESQNDGKCNIVLRPNVHLFAALIQKHTGQQFNFIRAKLYEKCWLDRTKGQTAVQGKYITLPCNKKLETKQTTPVQPREQNEDLSYKWMSRTLKSNPSNYKSWSCNIEFTNDLKKNMTTAYNALKNGKQTIMKQFPKLTTKEYDEIAKKCLWILYKETKIGLDMETSTLLHNTTWISELRWNSAVGNQTYQTRTNIVNKLKAVWVQSIEDFNDIATWTKGTMVVLIQRYYDLIKPRVKLWNRKNSQNELMTQDNCYEYLYYIWNNYQWRITWEVSKRIPPKELYACRVINRFIQLSVQE